MKTWNPEPGTQNSSFAVTRLIHFCYGHRLMNYDGKCRHPHGHNGKLEVTVQSQKTDRLGMVVDFERIKETVEKWVQAELDHKMLLGAGDPLVKILKDLGEPVYVMTGNPTAEHIARLVFGQAKRQGLNVVSVRLWETPNSFAEFKA